MKNKKGFSLLELIIVIAVLSVIMGAVAMLAQRMTTAAANQRRNQAHHAAEEQARLALLNMARDIRMSSSADVLSGDLLVLTATNRYGNTFTITYTLTPITTPQDVDVYDASGFILAREFDQPIVISDGDGQFDWPNSFSPVTVNGIEITPYFPIGAISPADGRMSLEIELLVPMMPGEAGTVHLTDATGLRFRQEFLRSSVSYQRIPQPFI